MNRTKDAKQARNILTLRFGTKNFRIGKDGTIRVHGTMPTPIKMGGMSSAIWPTAKLETTCTCPPNPPALRGHIQTKERS
jgi:hypothetical protein